MKTDSEKIRTVVEFFQQADPRALYAFCKSPEVQKELLEIADNLEAHTVKNYNPPSSCDLLGHKLNKDGICTRCFNN